MTTITFNKNSIEVSGHTKSIVCAGISAVVMGAINWFEQEDISVTCDEKNALISLVLLKNTKPNQEKLELILMQLKSMKKYYDKYIDFKEGK